MSAWGIELRTQAAFSPPRRFGSFPVPTMKFRILPLLAALVVSSARIHAQQAPSDVEHIPDLIYTKHDGVALTMDVFKPANQNGAGIIKVVSGGWKSNHTGINDGGWTKAGYTVFTVVHGTQPRFHIDEIIADLNRAVRYVRANAPKYGVDPNKLGITGGSAGGHLSLSIGAHGGPGDPNAADPIDRESSAVQAVACFYPPTDFLNWRNDGDSAVGVGVLADLNGAFGPRADTEEGRAKLGVEISPITYVHQGQPPIFIVHGDADPRVDINQAYRFQKRCADVGAICEVLVRHGGAHGGWDTADDYTRMIEWFNLHLLGKQPATPFYYSVSCFPMTPKVKK